MLVQMLYIDGSLDMYRELNEGRTLWNPTDVTKKITHSYFIEDGSFLRCQDLTVGYTLPGNLTSKWGDFESSFFMYQPLICLLLLGIRVMILKWIFRQD